MVTKKKFKKETKRSYKNKDNHGDGLEKTLGRFKSLKNLVNQVKSNTSTHQVVDPGNESMIIIKTVDSPKKSEKGRNRKNYPNKKY